jgi:hypothetical protein
LPARWPSVCLRYVTQIQAIVALPGLSLCLRGNTSLLRDANIVEQAQTNWEVL